MQAAGHLQRFEKYEVRLGELGCIFSKMTSVQRTCKGQARAEWAGASSLGVWQAYSAQN